MLPHRLLAEAGHSRFQIRPLFLKIIQREKDVTFEHVRPLSKMYQMLLDERETLTLERAAFIIGEYPPILIMTQEKLRMAKLGFKTGGTPEQRYGEVPISGFSLRSDGASHEHG
jgi:hypothetical protein